MPATPKARARRGLEPAAVALGLALLSWSPACREHEPERAQRAPDPPERVIVIVVDTLRRDHVGAYGSPVETPHLDALARRGRALDHAVASFHQTSMSMASLFTGRTPSLESGDAQQTLEWNGQSWCGMRRFADGDAEARCVPRSLPTLAEGFADSGYWTAAIVNNAFLFRPAGFDRGFDAWVELRCETEGGRADGPSCFRSRSGDRTNRAVADLLGERPTDRFFLYVHYMDVHDHLDAGRSYAESVALADRAVGELIGRLDEESLLDDAVLVLTADHGERLEDRHLVGGLRSHHGNPSFEEVLRVPLIVVPSPGEGPLPEPMRSDDVHRLLERIAGIDADAPSDLRDGELFVSEAFFQTYRRGHWKSFRPRGGRLLLVDLEADPRERVDVAREHPNVAARHGSRMDRLTEELAAAPASASDRLTDEDEHRLRVLGYLE